MELVELQHGVIMSCYAQMMFVSKSHDIFNRRILLFEIFVVGARADLQQFGRDAAPVEKIAHLLDRHIGDANVLDFSS